MRVELHRAEIERLLHSPDGPVVQEVEKYTRRTETAGKRRSPVDGGTLRTSIQHETTVQGHRVVGTVWTPLDYGMYQHQGTGVYVGNGPIKPKSGKFLVFQPKQAHPQGRGKKGGKGPVVFAKQVKGVPPNPFLKDALVATVPWPVRDTT